MLPTLDTQTNLTHAPELPMPSHATEPSEKLTRPGLPTPSSPPGMPMITRGGNEGNTVEDQALYSIVPNTVHDEKQAFSIPLYNVGVL